MHPAMGHHTPTVNSSHSGYAESGWRSVEFEDSESSTPTKKTQKQKKKKAKIRTKSEGESNFEARTEETITISQDILLPGEEPIEDDPHEYDPVKPEEIEEYLAAGELRRVQYCKYRKNVLDILQPVVPDSDDNLSPAVLGAKYKDIFGSIKCVMIDVSGTLYTGNDVVTQYADQAIERLRKLGLKLLFLENTSKESSKTLLARLRELGFDIKDDELFTSVMACNKYLIENDYRPHLLLDEGVREDFDPNLSHEKPTALVVGSKPRDVGYEKLTKAIAMLMDGAALIGTHRGHQNETEIGQELGPGPFIDALQFITGVKAIVTGKPEELFFKSLLESCGYKPEEIVLIGDDVFEDIIGANKVGLKSILVKTGKYHHMDEIRISPVEPEFISRNFALAVRCIESAISVKQRIEPTYENYLDPESLKTKESIPKEVTTRDFLEKMQAYMNPCLHEQRPCAPSMDFLFAENPAVHMSPSQFIIDSNEPKAEMYIEELFDPVTKAFNPHHCCDYMDEANETNNSYQNHLHQHGHAPVKSPSSF